MDVENKQDINDIKSSEEIQKDNNNENNNKKEMNDN